MEKSHLSLVETLDSRPSANGGAASVSSSGANGQSTHFCETVVIDDYPATEDNFGPHTKIANAIVKLIREHNGAISIGLEGCWGSGKTTIVEMLTHKLREENGQEAPDKKQFVLIPFDAWAHEGDPLRRTFLESLIRQLIKEEWIDEKNWDKRLKDISNPKEVTETIVPPLKGLGKLVATLVFFVPLGTAMVGGVVEKNVRFTFEPSLTSIDLTTTVFLYLGVLFTLAPLVVIATAVLRQRWNLWRQQKPEKANEQSEAEIEPLDLWSLLFQRNERTRVVTTPNPTSLEFERCFDDLMKEALKPEAHNIVFVLDNLDRVSPTDALSIWSTLQIFVKQSQFTKPPWSKRISIIVLYDPKGIRLLWDRNMPGNANGGPDQNGITPFFLDKSFQIRFEVPSPVLSDWRTYLVKILLKEAFPVGHDDDFHTIYQVISLDSAQRGEIPTIRELKLYVNQIGMFHRQWETHDVKLSHIAYFVLLRRRGLDVARELKSVKREIPTDAFIHLLGNDLEESLAALAFNVEKAKALQLLFGGRINKALAEGEIEALKELSKSIGFWEALPNVIAHDWLKEDINRLPLVANCLHESGILKEDRPEAVTVKDFLRVKAEGKGYWDLLDPLKLEGITSLFKLRSDRALMELVLKEAVTRLIEKGKEGRVLNIKDWATNQRDLWQQFYEDDIPASVIQLIYSQFGKSVIEDDLLSTLLESLIECDQASTGDNAHSALSELVRKGHLLHQLLIRSTREPKCHAWCLFTLLFYWSFGRLDPDPQHKTRALEYIQQPYLANDKGLISELAGLITRYGSDISNDIEPFIRLLNTSPSSPITPPLRKACLKILIENEKPEELFTKELIFKYWSIISKDLMEDDLCLSALNKLIKRSAENDHLIEVVRDKGFDAQYGSLYEILLKYGGVYQDTLWEWCRKDPSQGPQA
jgi:hypothetical protein